MKTNSIEVVNVSWQTENLPILYSPIKERNHSYGKQTGAHPQSEKSFEPNRTQVFWERPKLLKRNNSFAFRSFKKITKASTLNTAITTIIWRIKADDKLLFFDRLQEIGELRIVRNHPIAMTNNPS